MPKAVELSDRELHRLISYDVRTLERTDLTDEQRKLVQRRYGICISEAIRRVRVRHEKNRKS
jgi:hypothetical protein